MQYISSLHFWKKILTLLCLLTFYTNANADNTNVSQFGTVGNGKALDTKALQKAIDICHQTGGGQVTVPPGIYLTGTLYLRSNVELHLCRGAVLLGSFRNPQDYPVRSLIMADSIENAGISGEGIIDGQARHPEFQKRYQLNDGKRPYAIFYKDCQRMSLRNVEVRDAAGWTIRLFRCDGVNINGIRIHSLSMGNNDGIDVDARNVNINNCHIECDDDGICLKSDDPDFLPENIVISNCVIASNCNPIKLGTASWAGFRNVTISNCVIRPTTESNIWDWSKEYRQVAPGTKTGLSGIAIESADGGIIENITCSNITMEGIITPIFICLNHRRMNHHTGTTGVIRRVQFNNIVAVANGIIPTLISGTPQGRISDIVLRDIMVEHAGGEMEMKETLPENLNGYPENRMYGRTNPAGGLYVRHADNIVVENFQVSQRKEDARPAVYLDDVTQVRIEKLQSKNSTARHMVETRGCQDVSVDGQAIQTDIPLFLQWADTLMTSMYEKFMQDGKKEGIWKERPNPSSNIAALWGQGAALSGYTRIRRASEKYAEYKAKYAPMADELFDKGIETFKTIRDDVLKGLEAYACYPGAGNERFYDDDVWIALDMIDMYEQTHEQKYLERAKLIWQFLMSGFDKRQGGGIYWKEQDRNAKHTCSTAPTAVMAARLYLLTGEKAYKEKAIELYAWLKKKLQDPEDHLFYDNIRVDGEIGKAKFSYNTGQPMQAAALLYRITKEEKYLKDAQLMAESAFRHWFKTFESPWLKKNIAYIDGHTWFNAILMRGYVELYRIDKNRKYIDAYEQMFSNLWLSPQGHNRSMQLLNYKDFRGLTPQDDWEVIYIGACVEMLAQLAILESEGL